MALKSWEGDDQATIEQSKTPDPRARLPNGSFPIASKAYRWKGFDGSTASVRWDGTTTKLFNGWVECKGIQCALFNGIDFTNRVQLFIVLEDWFPGTILLNTPYIINKTSRTGTIGVRKQAHSYTYWSITSNSKSFLVKVLRADDIGPLEQHQ